MTITGLENNYYLTFNDVLVKVNGITEPSALLEVTVKNLTTGQQLPPFRMSPSPANDYTFSITTITTALFPEPDHLANNSLQNFQIDFRVKFTAVEIADETQSLIKYFVRGGRNRKGNAEWYLSSGDELIVGKWITWNGVTLPGNAQRLVGGSIISFNPTNPYRMLRYNCDSVILKFLNSLGGYQYFIFDSHEIKSKSRSRKTIGRTAYQLRENNFQNIGNETERVIEFTAKTPAEVQEVFTDLIQSVEVLLLDSISGTWERLKLDDNESVENTFDKVYENKATFILPNYQNRYL